MIAWRWWCWANTRFGRLARYYHHSWWLRRLWWEGGATISSDHDLLLFTIPEFHVQPTYAIRFMRSLCYLDREVFKAGQLNDQYVSYGPIANVTLLFRRTLYPSVCRQYSPWSTISSILKQWGPPVAFLSNMIWWRVLCYSSGGQITLVALTVNMQLRTVLPWSHTCNTGTEKGVAPMD